MAFTAIVAGLNTQPSVYAAGAAPVLNPIVYQAMDNVNGNSFVPNGKTILLVRNTDSATHTISISGVADQFGATPATGTITVPILGTAGGEVSMGPFPASGPWVQSDGTVHITCSSALLYVAVLTLPG